MKKKQRKKACTHNKLTYILDTKLGTIEPIPKIEYIQGEYKETHARSNSRGAAKMKKNKRERKLSRTN